MITFNNGAIEFNSKTSSISLKVLAPIADDEFVYLQSEEFEKYYASYSWLASDNDGASWQDYGKSFGIELEANLKIM